jgi:hypothetical protein
MDFVFYMMCIVPLVLLYVYFFISAFSYAWNFDQIQKWLIQNPELLKAPPTPFQPQGYGYGMQMAYQQQPYQYQQQPQPYAPPAPFGQPQAFNQAQPQFPAYNYNAQGMILY